MLLDWFANNLATVLVSLALAAILGLIVFFAVRNRKKGKSSCGCGCESCPVSGSCHQK